MSAWVVCKAHIDALVQACIAERVIRPSEANEIGAKLWAENHASVNYRYAEAEAMPAYKFEGIEARLDDAVIASNIRCYWYQTSEHPDAKVYDDDDGPLGQLLDALIARHGNPRFDEAIRQGRETLHGYEHRFWGLSDIKEAIAA